MDGTDLMLDNFRSALSSQDDPGRVIGVDYPFNEELSVPELAHFTSEKYLEPLAQDPRGYVLVNQSFSGHVGLHLASKTPPGILQAQVFVNSFVSPPAPSFLRNIPTSVGDRLFQNQPPPWLVGRIFLGPNAKGMHTVQAAASQVLPAVMSHRLGICLNEDSWHIWRNSDQISADKTLYLRGDSDVIVRKRDAHTLKASRPDIEWVHVEGGPHLLLQRYGTECGTAVDTFCRSLPL